MQYLFQVHLTFLASLRRFQLETVAPPLIGFTAENFLNQTNQWDLNFQLGVDLILLRFSGQKGKSPKQFCFNISGRKKTQSVFFLGVEGHVEIVGTGGEQDEKKL